MTGVVTFSYPQWAARYPELAAAVLQPEAQAYFDEACLYLNNTALSVVRDLAARALILNMITAHIAQLNRKVSGALASPIVGRISSATQGSVTVQAAFEGAKGSAQWWLQTPYGTAAWQALARYRTAHYRPGHQRSMQPWIGGFPRG